MPKIEEERQTETEYWAVFAKAQPRILGALLDCAAGALATQDSLGTLALPNGLGILKSTTCHRFEVSFRWLAEICLDIDDITGAWLLPCVALAENTHGVFDFALQNLGTRGYRW